MTAAAPSSAQQDEVLLRMRGMSKFFPGVQALHKVDLTVHVGEVAALLGENGAGKSTLMNILAGVHADYEGDIEIRGEHISIRSPKEAQQYGIAMIHQELNLVPELSIADNIFLGRELRTARGTLDRKAMYRRTVELLALLGLSISPRTLVRQCRIAEQQLFEVAKALNMDVRVLVMDEPTSALADAEVGRLFGVIRELTASGVGVIYISHRLEELEEIADSVTVLRDGKLIGRREMVNNQRAELVSLMVGRPLGEFFPREPDQQSTGQVALEVRGLTFTPKTEEGATPLRGLDFQVRCGEIVGLAGLMGSGRSETLESLYGAKGRVAGTIFLAGKRYRPYHPRGAIRRGIALVAEDRKAQNLILDNTVRFNATLSALARYLRPWRTIDRKRERADVNAKVVELKVKTPTLNASVRNLSGGNQQKVVLAKCLLTNPTVLLLDEPTRGVDVGAKAEIHALMSTLARRGTAILLVSSELPELIGMCDRVLVLSEGRLTGEFYRDSNNGPVVDQESILTAAMDRHIVLDTSVVGSPESVPSDHGKAGEQS